MRSAWHLAAGASTVLLLATMALWVRSYFAIDWIEVHKDWKLCAVSGNGAVSVFTVVPIIETFSSNWTITETVDKPYSAHWQFACSQPSAAGRDGFGLTSFSARRFHTSGAGELGSAKGERQFVVRFPYWVLVLVFAVAPALFTRKWRRRMRLSGNLCSSCGYDIRASPDRCPECGTVPGRAAVSKPLA